MKALRQWLTARLSEGAVRCAPRLSESGVAKLQAAIAWGGPRFPVVSRMVADNMRAVGVYSPEIHREYFRQAATHLTGWLHVFRHSGPTAAAGTNGIPPALARLAAERIQFDQSVALLKEAASDGRGVILMAMHITDMAMWATRISQEVPCTGYGRYSKDARRQQIKERCWRTMGLSWVSEPSEDDQPGARLAKMAEALHAGRVVLITPDLVRKRDEGRPVRFFDREIYLPSGPAVLSLMTGAPLMMIGAHPSGESRCVTFHGPLPAETAPPESGRHEAALTERMQWFAEGLQTLLQSQPALWFFWGDKRWTRVFQGDPRYVRFLNSTGQDAAATECRRGGQ
jgi:lauroyl/myristoyl acyltransferase